MAFFRLSDDAALAIALSDKEALAEMAVAEFGHFQLLRDRIQEMRRDPRRRSAPFVAAIDAFHARTAPADWLEGLVKAYVGDGIAADFYRAVAELLDQDTGRSCSTVLADTGHAEFVVARVRAAIEADPKVAGRLALWARRLVGRGARPGSAGRGRAGGAGSVARRRDGDPAGRHRPDVRQAHRRTRRPDVSARPGQLAAAASDRIGPKPTRRGSSPPISR